MCATNTHRHGCVLSVQKYTYICATKHESKANFCYKCVQLKHESRLEEAQRNSSTKESTIVLSHTNSSSGNMFYRVFYILKVKHKKDENLFPDIIILFLLPK